MPPYQLHVLPRHLCPPPPTHTHTFSVNHNYHNDSIIESCRKDDSTPTPQRILILRPVASLVCSQSDTRFPLAFVNPKMVTVYIQEWKHVNQGLNGPSIALSVTVNGVPLYVKRICKNSMSSELIVPLHVATPSR